MSNRNEFSAGLGAKVCGAVADAGGTPEELNGFSENVTLVKQLLAVIRGTAKIVVTEVAKILQLAKAKTSVPALKTLFVVKDHFIVDVSDKAEVKISYIGDNFKQQFIKQTVAPRGELNLSSWKLSKNSLDKPILDELGDKQETDIVAVYDLMKLQPKGEKGVLLTNGYANIFYCRDAAGVLQAVYVDWGGGGWNVDSCLVENPSEWDEGRQVFSCNSVA